MHEIKIGFDENNCGFLEIKTDDDTPLQEIIEIAKNTILEISPAPEDEENPPEDDFIEEGFLE